MKLNFEIIGEVGVGNYPDLIHFPNTQAQIFYVGEGEIKGLPSEKIPFGEWDNVVCLDGVNTSPDTNISHFQVDILQGFGIIGNYKTSDTHKLLIYEFAYEMDRYLSSGSIKHSIDNPISSFTLTLENPDLKDPEHPGNIAINEENSLLSPGAKVVFKFSMGDSEDFELGSFYIDRSNYSVGAENAKVDGRNLVGKVLKDQTLDEDNEYWYNTISNILKDLFESSGVDRDSYIIENTGKRHWFTFSPNTNYLDAINQMLELLIGWKVTELADNTIVISEENSVLLPMKQQYIFERNKDIFSRGITRDDGEVYSRVCVHTKSQAFMVFRDVAVYEGWSLEAKKTLYVSVADGSKFEDVENYADELKSILENSGKIESFTGPFRPQLICGDEAVIVSEKGNTILGLITEITHKFGKNGYYTDFVVDSGGRIGRGRISDYIKKISIGAMSGSISAGSSDIDTSAELYRNIASQSKIITPRMLFINKLTDGVTDETVDDIWIGSTREGDQDFILFDFSQRCIINKIAIHRKYFRKEVIVERWNGAIWSHLFTINEGEDYSVTNTFDNIETSKIRLRFGTNVGVVDISEVEIWGWM